MKKRAKSLLNQSTGRPRFSTIGTHRNLSHFGERNQVSDSINYTPMRGSGYRRFSSSKTNRVEVPKENPFCFPSLENSSVVHHPKNGKLCLKPQRTDLTIVKQPMKISSETTEKKVNDVLDCIAEYDKSEDSLLKSMQVWNFYAADIRLRRLKKHCLRSEPTKPPMNFVSPCNGISAYSCMSSASTFMDPAMGCGAYLESIGENS
jgi:hypothetical protein